MQFHEFNFYFFFLGFILTTILATAIPLDEASSSLVSRYEGLFSRDSCICEYDPEDLSKWDDCVDRCQESSKRVYLSERDLSHMTRATCYCPFNQTSCDCGPIRPRPPKQCCGIIHPPILLSERDAPINTTPVLHARACPPNQEQVCYVYRGIKYCVPCIEERIVCPLEDEQIICLDDADGIIRCPPCRPPRPPICPLCVSHRNGTIVCPRPCPTSPIVCPLYCIDYPNGTVVCPGCGDRPPRTYTNPNSLPSATTNT
ncbi:hypothetical protein L486_00384 [Kwoniella mangroviensis CBS 10435]|uniref:Uncharacterized protein n=1 Tax=Kwoniella mangroviensis CBS 10435 TaxID=1331196 RepID=A0A1B9IZA6_9TREE|nr:hypothetical protein L486_00384 [Kwoniella mangroviensis CBS 10435]